MLTTVTVELNFQVARNRMLIFLMVLIIGGIITLSLIAKDYRIVDEISALILYNYKTPAAVFITADTVTILTGIFATFGFISKAYAALLCAGNVFLVFSSFFLFIGITCQIEFRNWDNFAGNMDEDLMQFFESNRTSHEENFYLMQKRLRCCGVLGRMDYMKVKNTSTLPLSCCKHPRNNTCTDNDKPWTSGCYHSLLTFLLNLYYRISLFSIVTCIILLEGFMTTYIYSQAVYEYFYL